MIFNNKYLAISIAVNSIFFLSTTVTRKALSQPERKNITGIFEQKQYTGVVESVNNIAEQITIIVETNNNSSHGSGVIIARENNTYYVATAKHVVNDKQNYKIVTPETTIIYY